MDAWAPRRNPQELLRSMRVGIIAEGRGDLAVLKNILKGWLNLDRESIQYLRPEYDLDETDLHSMPAEQRSNWGLVKQECVDGKKIIEFLECPIDEERFVVIHIDAAESELDGYDVERPTGDVGDSLFYSVRTAIVAKINEWPRAPFNGCVRFAIAIEEMDSWVRTIYAPESVKDTGAHRNAKERLKKEVNKSNQFSLKRLKQLYQLKTFQQYDSLTHEFRKKTTLANCAKRNRSLHLFLDSLSLPGTSADTVDDSNKTPPG